jgi:hypothetical protein
MALKCKNSVAKTFMVLRSLCIKSTTIDFMSKDTIQTVEDLILLILFLKCTSPNVI